MLKRKEQQLIEQCSVPQPEAGSYKHGGERGNQNEWNDDRKREYEAVGEESGELPTPACSSDSLSCGLLIWYQQSYNVRYY